MIKVSPLGAIAIAILTARWNSSKDKKRKELVKRFLLSGNTLQIHQGMDNLLKLADDQLQTIRWSGTMAIKTEFILWSIGVALMAEGVNTSVINKLIFDARTEASRHFIDLFRSGHFKKLPMPEFGYELPPSTKSRALVFSYKVEGGNLTRDVPKSIIRVSKRKSKLNTTVHKNTLGCFDPKKPTSIPGVKTEPDWGGDR